MKPYKRHPNTTDKEQAIAELIAKYFKQSVKRASAFSLKIDKDLKLNAKAKREGYLQRIKCVSLIVFKASEYSDMKTVKNAVENNEREAVKEPDWRETVHINGCPFKRHKTKGTLYLGFPVFSFGKAVYTLDGEQVTKESLREFFQPSAFAEKPSKEQLADKGQVEYRSPKLENIVSVI